MNSEPDIEWVPENAEEKRVRSMRDKVYGPNKKYCSNSNWVACREKWMAPDAVAWLEKKTK